MWTLTEAGVAANGTSRCSSPAPAPGVVYTFPITVSRTATLVSFDWGVVTDGVDFAGSIAGEAFTATTQDYSFGNQGACPWSEILTVTGAFSDDGMHLTAQEADVYHLPDGDVTYTWNWTADHQ